MSRIFTWVEFSDNLLSIGWIDIAGYVLSWILIYLIFYKSQEKVSVRKLSQHKKKHSNWHNSQWQMGL